MPAGFGRIGVFSKSMWRLWLSAKSRCRKTCDAERGNSIASKTDFRCAATELMKRRSEMTLLREATADSVFFQFGDPHYRRFSQKKQEELGLVGNDLWGNRSAKAGALLCPASNRSEKIAVSKSGLEYLAAAVERGERITSGEVVFYQSYNKSTLYILRMNVVDVVAKLKGVPPREGKYGPFWLFNRDGTPEDDDVPF
jgi:hypothetical protein